MKRLMRIPAEGRIAGVCAGIAHYLDTDVTLVRAAWLVLSIVPGAMIGGLLAYAGAWLVMPPTTVPGTTPSRRHLTRSRLDRRIAGVCGGIAEYAGVDPTVVRVAVVVLAIYPGAIVGGLIAYAVAWFILPADPPLARSCRRPDRTPGSHRTARPLLAAFVTCAANSSARRSASIATTARVAHAAGGASAVVLDEQSNDAVQNCARSCKRLS